MIVSFIGNILIHFRLLAIFVMMEFLSDSTVNSFSSETLSPDLSSDISNKSSVETVTSSPDSRLKESLSSTSTVHSKHKKISQRTSRSSESETVSQLTSTDGSSFQVK